MASSTILCPKQGKHLLKDFLLHDYHSNEFNPFPRKASKTISAFQAMINIVKNIHFITTIKSPSVLPRNLSRKLSKRNSQVESEIKMTTVRVKDIMRWKSFRDLVDKEFQVQQSDFASSSCSSNGSSWCDRYFTSEYSPTHVLEDPTETKTEVAAANAGMRHKSQGRNYASEEKEQQSPLSVLGFRREEDDDQDSFSTNYKHFQSSVDLGKWMSLEEDEERSLKLLNHVKETTLLTKCDNICTDKLVFDLFIEELNQTKDTEVENEMVRVSKAWINGETSKWGFVDNRESFVIEMEREGRWGKFVEEQKELAWEIERELKNILADELLVDFLWRIVGVRDEAIYIVREASVLHNLIFLV